ncbi:PREDICTED: probable G-protein coupled receptor 33 [Nanorana parkeri]|uniref:probable G-protein coupled receptor 33 n=1 Tax=Nanorana parkeri TaxID=125878 RepID=UPI0008548FDB|nr:PREDICTED: probable G-protein coupled receptor 33 [Nanorana parkeri]
MRERELGGCSMRQRELGGCSMRQRELGGSSMRQRELGGCGRLITVQGEHKIRQVERAHNEPGIGHRQTLLQLNPLFECTMVNTSSLNSIVNTSTGPSPFEITASKLTGALLLLINFLFGLAVNALYLWVLKFRMKRGINNVWLSHLVFTNLVFLLLQPFLAVYVLMAPHWIFGMFLCKVFHCMMSICLFASVFLMTAVSLNRYLLVYYPHWYIGHIRLHNVSAVCYGLWGLAFLCSFPYLLFRVTEQTDNITVCYNDYSLSGQWEDAEDQVKWGMFFFRIFVSFLLPAAVITICHFKILIKIKKGQRRSSTKPYKVIFLATATFFICCALYHIAYGMSLERGRFKDEILLTLKIVSTCGFSCLSQICYLLIVDNLTKEFKKIMRSFTISAS